MPLSEEELRLLEQMERALVEEDPKLASTLRGTTLRRAARRRAIVAGVVFVVGIVVLMTGAISAAAPSVGIVGFVIMLGLRHHRPGALRGQQAPPARRPPAHRQRHRLAGFTRHRRRPAAAAPASRAARVRGSFMERIEERWRRRREPRLLSQAQVR